MSISTFGLAHGCVAYIVDGGADEDSQREICCKDVEKYLEKQISDDDEKWLMYIYPRINSNSD